MVARERLAGGLVGPSCLVILGAPTDTDDAPLSGSLVASSISIVALALVGFLGSFASIAACGRQPVTVLLIAYAFAWAPTVHVAMMLAVPVPVGQDETQDNAAGASLVILFVPTVFIVIALAGLETVIGAVWGSIGRHRTHRRADSFL